MAAPIFQSGQWNRACVGNNWLVSLSLLSLVLARTVAAANDLPVGDPDSFLAALHSARSGDQILLAPGTYRGTFHASRLSGVTIRSADPSAPAVIDATGAGEGLKLSQADRVTIADLIIEHADANGINIDDGGYQRPSTRIVIRRVVVRHGGGHAIKLAGVDGFLIDSVTLEDWGNGHAGFNLIGVHNGIVQHSVVRRTNTSGGFGLKVEGGSTNVAIRGNRFENAGERAVQFGGSVGLHLFRTRTTDGATTERVVAEGNVIVNKGADGEGIRAAVAFIGAREAEFRYNLVFRPGVFVGRVLREGSHPAAADIRERVFRNNAIIWYEGDFAPAHAFNAGPDTFPESLEFRANRWVNLSPHGASEVLLPTKEQGPSYGFDPGFRPHQSIAWEFAWGQWIVNATAERQVHRVEPGGALNVATPGRRARFAPAFSDPLVGRWEFERLSGEEVVMPSMSAVILVNDAVRAAAHVER